MALTSTQVNRTNPASGDVFRTFSDGSARAQAVGVVDADGNPVAYGDNAISTGLADSLVVKAAAGQLGEIHAYQDGLSGSAVCFMLFNSTTLPANSTVPVWRIPIVGGVAQYWFPTGFQFSTGLVGAFSSTAANLTVTTGATEGYIQARYR